MERGDVLERNQDVPVQLDVCDILEVTVRSEHAVLILAAEERDLDLLALVLVRVVLHASGRVYPATWASRPSTIASSVTSQLPMLGIVNVREVA